MQLLNVTNFPIYLPRDVAQGPFGEPFEDVTIVEGTGTTDPIFTIDGYEPTNGDAMQLDFTAGGSLPTGFSAFTTYYVVGANAATGAFSLSATKGGASISHNTVTTGGVNMVAHLLSDQEQEIPLPFKPGYGSVVVANLSAGTLVLQGAADAGAGFDAPQGPGAWNTIVSVGAGAMALAKLSYDWIRVSTSGTLALLQN